MGRLSEALNARLRESYRTGRYTVNRDTAQRRSDIDQQMNKIVGDFYKILDKYNTSISKKTILERAGKVVIAGLKQKSEAIEDTGNLRQSVGWIRIKSKVSVMAGFNYWKGGRHAHLVEYGFIAKNGEYVPGYNLVKNTYEETKEKVISNLIEEFKKETDKLLREIGR